MKILCGALRGRVIPFKANPHLRPTSDKARKALFDALQGAVEDRAVLDLFSGTGALGFEALSLGAGRVVFVESDRGQAAKIKQCAEALGVSDRAVVECAAALSAIASHAKKKDYFDLVFLDPPYDKGLAAKTLEALAHSGLLNADSLVVAECRQKEGLPERFGCLRAIRGKTYGDTKIVFYRVEEHAD